ncbi:hypothetical protein BGZ65_009085 [Modicella reniformis]|uniref:SRPBCC domain-containing protein n=1 Tax=Modicella reniformis TaxID=1440133 RepID=A0A9P6MAR4_9FUNG|nr:hypothetical protein BGZ65_009085 [Modicella reniformis]
MKENKASITISAPPHEVWKVLTDLEHYHEWNPMFIQASGTVAVGESLRLKMRLPSTLFCGAPISKWWSPKIIKVEPNSCLEWFAPASGIKGFIDGTHYFHLACSQGGAATEFTQGEHYEGWGSGLYSGSGSMRNARRGFVAMNNALNQETIRRQTTAKKSTGHSGGFQEKRKHDSEQDGVAQLDISDPAAVAAATVAATATANPSSVLAIRAMDVASDATLVTENEQRNKDVENGRNHTNGTTAATVPLTVGTAAVEATEQTTAECGADKPSEKVERRSSIIGAVSSLFSSSKQPASERMPTSTSKEELISKDVLEEHEGDEEDEEEGGDDEMVGIKGYKAGEIEVNEEEKKTREFEVEVEVEDTVEMKARETKNAERIELDFGSGGMDFGDFGF